MFTPYLRSFIKSYLKSRLAALILIMLCCALFAICFILYRLPLKAVLYPAILSISAAAGLAVYDFIKTFYRHKYLESVKRLDAELIPELPESGGVLCSDYTDIIYSVASQYVQSKNDAAKRFSDMNEYYTLWTHQIKTPISAMRLYIQSEDTELCGKLRTELQRIEAYVEMVLAFQKLESGGIDYVIKEHDIDEILRQSVKKFSSEFIMRKIKLIYEPFRVKAVTDEKWLSFVIEQIISNSLKYTEKGSITLRLEEPLTIVIEDTGIGISEEDLPRIFENGFTGCNGRADKRASGIGLYICRRICENLGAEISAESEPGKGTAVRIKLPRRTTVYE